MSFSSFFHQIGSELKKLFQKEPQWEQIAQGVITYAAPIVLTILAFVEPAAEPLAAKIISVVQADLATVNAVIKSSTGAPSPSAVASIQSALHSVNENLADLLQMAQIKNSAKVAQITAVVNSVTSEVDALLANLPAAPAAA